MYDWDDICYECTGYGDDYMNYDAIVIWFTGMIIMYLRLRIDDVFTVYEKIEFILWFCKVYSLAIAAAILFIGT